MWTLTTPKELRTATSRSTTTRRRGLTGFVEEALAWAEKLVGSPHDSDGLAAMLTERVLRSTVNRKSACKVLPSPRKTGRPAVATDSQLDERAG